MRRREGQKIYSLGASWASDQCQQPRKFSGAVLFQSVQLAACPMLFILDSLLPLRPVLVGSGVIARAVVRDPVHWRKDAMIVKMTTVRRALEALPNGGEHHCISDFGSATANARQWRPVPGLGYLRRLGQFRDVGAEVIDRVEAASEYPAFLLIGQRHAPGGVPIHLIAELALCPAAPPSRQALTVARCEGFLEHHAACAPLSSGIVHELSATAASPPGVAASMSAHHSKAGLSDSRSDRDTTWCACRPQ